VVVHPRLSRIHVRDRATRSAGASVHFCSRQFTRFRPRLHHPMLQPCSFAKLRAREPGRSVGSTGRRTFGRFRRLIRTLLVCTGGAMTPSRYRPARAGLARPHQRDERDYVEIGPLKADSDRQAASTIGPRCRLEPNQEVFSHLSRRPRLCGVGRNPTYTWLRARCRECRERILVNRERPPARRRGRNAASAATLMP
jgi:hypothetical protein